MYKLLGRNGLLFLLAQPLGLFAVSKLRSTKLLYLAALVYIAGQDYWPVKELMVKKKKQLRFLILFCVSPPFFISCFSRTS